MMATVYDFTPSATAPYQFQPTLDGQLYLATVKWNLAGQRWYMELISQGGALVFLQSLKSSAVGQAIAAASWFVSSSDVTITTAQPHGYTVGSTVRLTISGITPTAYNGVFECFVTSPTTFVYSVSTNPGTATAFGVVSYDINMAAGYFSASTLVWRAANNRFEVTP